MGAVTATTAHIPPRHHFLLHGRPACECVVCMAACIRVCIPADGAPWARENAPSSTQQPGTHARIQVVLILSRITYRVPYVSAHTRAVPPTTCNCVFRPVNLVLPSTGTTQHPSALSHLAEPLLLCILRNRTEPQRNPKATQACSDLSKAAPPRANTNIRGKTAPQLRCPSYPRILP